jgi:hypothetical protein
MNQDFKDTIVVTRERTKREHITEPSKWDGLWWVATFAILVIYVTLPLWVTPR